MPLVEVTQSDIDGATPGDCRKDPVARAIRRIVPDSLAVGVFLATVSIGPDCTLELPASVQEALRTFDIGGGMQPFSFPLDIPAEIFQVCEGTPT